MKKMFRVLTAAAMMILTGSCIAEINSELISDQIRTYKLSFSDATKTELSGTGSKRPVNWSEGDEIQYYTTSEQASAASAKVNVDDYSAYVTIPRGRNDEFINAVYGAAQLKSSSSSETVMYVTSPVKDNQRFTSFAKAHVCAAFSNDIENPNLKFHNAAPVFLFTSVAAVSKVVFRGNGDEIITGGSDGDLKIAFESGAITTTAASTGGTSVTIATNGKVSDFYFAILPVSFANGFTIDCYDADNLLFVSKKAEGPINTVSHKGVVKVLNLGSVQEWIDSAPPTAVDLGLSVKWASFNIGAAKPEDYGDYFAWGETAPKSEYKWANYQFGSSKNGPFSKYVIDSTYGTVDNKTVLDFEDDVAHTAWGENWRMPTKEEFAELMNADNCSWTWTTKNGVRGYRITSRISGYTANSIFLPANGMKSGASLSDGGTAGNYWTASISTDYPYYAISPFFDSSSTKSDNCYRYFGLGVRPVQYPPIPVSVIEIPDTFNLMVGSSRTISATVLPENATFKKLRWTSSDDSIAKVDANGMVTGVKVGSAIITVTTADGGVHAKCSVEVVEPEAVDLGLSVKWATFNVGATKPEEFGDYFAWGETEPKTDYSWSTYKYGVGVYYRYDTDLTKYNTVDNKTVLDPEDDAAHVILGGRWRMPRVEEIDELKNNCTWTRTYDYKGTGVAGMIVTSNKTGYTDRSVFLPAAGFWRYLYLQDEGYNLRYWSSSCYLSIAGALSISSLRWDYQACSRELGFSVRPVLMYSPTGISIDNAWLTLFVGKKAGLTATVKSNYNKTVNKSVKWSSSDVSVATVDQEGMVTGVNAGTAVVTVTTVDGGFQAECNVIVKEIPPKTEIGKKAVAVDLGLSVKWATFNVGATKPEEFGDYFAWGETEPKTDYSWSTYKWRNDSSKYNKRDKKTTLDLEDDASNVLWGGSWRMPRWEEMEELKNNCTWTWTFDYKGTGVAGMIVTSNKTGYTDRSIFLPAAGVWLSSNLQAAGSYLQYWSSSLYTDDPDYAWALSLSSDGRSGFSSGREHGFSVRPVAD